MERVEREKQHIYTAHLTNFNPPTHYIPIFWHVWIQMERQFSFPSFLRSNYHCIYSLISRRHPYSHPEQQRVHTIFVMNQHTIAYNLEKNLSIAWNIGTLCVGFRVKWRRTTDDGGNIIIFRLACSYKMTMSVSMSVCIFWWYNWFLC